MTTQMCCCIAHKFDVMSSVLVQFSYTLYRSPVKTNACTQVGLMYGLRMCACVVRDHAAVWYVAISVVTLDDSITGL